jgi:hypothetical protein
LKERRTKPERTQNPANPTIAASTRSSAAASTKNSAEVYDQNNNIKISAASLLTEKML